jgi:DNA-binding response OmpR family regulator
MGVRKNVLIVSSDYTFASFLEQELGPDFDVHSAATDIAAFALMDAYTYDCVVVDLSARSSAGSATVSGMHLNALTIPLFALVPPGEEKAVPPGAAACINRDDPIPRLANMVRKTLA